MVLTLLLRRAPVVTLKLFKETKEIDMSCYLDRSESVAKEGMYLFTLYLS